MSTLVTPPLVGATAPARLPAAQPTPPAYPRHLKWTAEEFNRVNATGVWEGRRAFLIDGVIWEQGPMNPPHAAGVRRLTAVLSRHTLAGHCFQSQLPVMFDAITELIPDGAVVPGEEGDYDNAHPTQALLVAEVSDTTLQFDRATKAELYAAAGVPTYWVVDLGNRLLHVFTDPEPLPPGGTAYRSRVELRDADTVAGPDGRPVLVAALLPPAG